MPSEFWTIMLRPCLSMLTKARLRLTCKYLHQQHSYIVQLHPILWRWASWMDRIKIIHVAFRVLFRVTKGPEANCNHVKLEWTSDGAEYNIVFNHPTNLDYDNKVRLRLFDHGGRITSSWWSRGWSNHKWSPITKPERQAAMKRFLTTGTVSEDDDSILWWET